jgi:uncharacterized protein (DUF885 family)
MRLILAGGLLVVLSAAGGLSQPRSDALESLATDFWSWRAHDRPFTFDDVARMEHAGGVRDWSAQAVARQKRELAEFERRWEQLGVSDRPVPEQVDYRLIGSALARVKWELEVYPRWQRDPAFYVEQTVAALQEALMPPPPFTADKAREIVVRTENVPSILEQARINLQPVAAFARLAADSLSDIDSRLRRVEQGVSPLLTSSELRTRFQSAVPKAIDALVAYRRWLEHGLPDMPREFAPGATAYGFYLHDVALLPYTPEQMLEMARQDLDRVVTAEALERVRNWGAPALRMAATAQEEVARMARDDASIRRFLTDRAILSVPADLPHWTLRPAPDYVLAFDGFGELDDFAGPSRMEDDGTRWIGPPSADLPYFFAAYAKDPRTTGVHEGVPGHFFQLSLSRRHPDPIRRHYYDSVANEGLGFYAEEMMLQAGLFDDSPRSREIIYSFARLRALRVEADVKLALGQFTIGQAADYLAAQVPMDTRSAETDAADYAASPGLGIAYEIGKLQIERLLARRRTAQGTGFSLRDFNDYLWSNGNVPRALLEWELLGVGQDLQRADALARMQ